MVGAHGRYELLHIAGDHRRRLELSFGLFVDIVYYLFGMESVPHYDSSEVLFML